MNKQRFIAELKRLLVFMTDSDRELTIEKYSLLFDEAGEEKEQAVIERLGSPTKLAIQLSRGYVPGQISTEHRQRQVLREAEKAARTVKSSLHGIDDYIPGTQFDDDDPVNIIMRSLDDEYTAGLEPEEEPIRRAVSEVPRWAEEPDAEPEAPVIYRRLDRPMPVGLGAVLLTLILLVLGIPLAAAAVCLVIVCVLPGAAALVCAFLSAVAALWCIAQLANALLLFGLAFVILALGLVLFWLGVRADVHIVKLYIRGVAALCDLLLGKKVAVE